MVRWGLKGIGVYFLYTIVDIARKEMILEEARVIREYSTIYLGIRRGMEGIFSFRRRRNKYLLGQINILTIMLVIGI